MKHPYPVKGKNRLDFGFRPRENVILPRFWLTKGKNRAILGFQQAFLSWLYFRQYSRGHSIQVMEIQRGQSGGSVFGRVAWGNARRGFTNTVASVRSCAQLYCASHSRVRRRDKGECSSPRPHEAFFRLVRTCSAKGKNRPQRAEVHCRNGVKAHCRAEDHCRNGAKAHCRAEVHSRNGAKAHCRQQSNSR